MTDAVTVLLYCNDGGEWPDAAGGHLRLHDPFGGAPTDVAPRGGTLVAFRSPLIEHEVLRCAAPRRALTLWAREGSHADVHWHMAPGETAEQVEARERRSAARRASA